MNWTPEKIERVGELLLNQRSLTEIGAKMGASRNAVASLIMRTPALRDMPGRNRTPGHHKNVGKTYKTRSDKGVPRAAQSLSVKASRKRGGILGGKPGKALLEARQAKQNLHAGNIQSKREARQHDPIYREPVATMGAAEYDAGCPRVSLVDHDKEPEIKIIDVYICKARRKLEPIGVRIDTVWGKGYALAINAKPLIVPEAA